MSDDSASHAATGWGMSPTGMAELEAQGFIVHSETRAHLPELSDRCVVCLRAEVERLTGERDEARRVAERIVAGEYGWPDDHLLPWEAERGQ